MGISESLTPKADRLFAKFTRMYGQQKVSSVWNDPSIIGSGPDVDTRRALHAASIREEWERQMDRFPLQVLGLAVDAVMDSGKDWPPTLPEFVALCRQYRRAESEAYVALNAPRNPEIAAAGVQAVASAVSSVLGDRDAIRWARNPKTFLAVQTLIRGSRHHEGLREILAAHSADPSRLPCDRSRKAVETGGRGPM